MTDEERQLRADVARLQLEVGRLLKENERLVLVVSTLESDLGRAIEVTMAASNDAERALREAGLL